MTTNREKMIAGYDYDASDPELVQAHLDCLHRLAEINDQNLLDIHQRHTLYSSLFKSFGKSFIQHPFWCDYGFNITIGDRCFINFDAVFLDSAPITLGDHVQIGPRCQLLTPLHPMEDHEARKAGVESAGPITIGNNVWLGGGVIICPNVTIGDNVVIGAGSVVTRDIPAHTFAAGNPARVQRQI
ncbi:sugar O-acetyltransferase [Corynebacterium kroppenstedtii]|nr:sugar O-acetyltransferase [Corynebacterium kroppenstedtii]